MTYRNNIATIEDVAISEGGVFTAAQAVRMGVPRDALTYAVRSGRVERIAQGAYRLAAAQDDGLDELRAIWKLTAPEKFSHERADVKGWDGVAVVGPTAAFIHEVGDFFVSPYHVAVPKRFNSRRKDVRFIRSDIARQDVTWQHGFPVLRLEAAIVSLVTGREDPSLVADAFVDAVRKYGSTLLDVKKLRDALGEKAFADVLRNAGIYPGSSRRLVALDALGHVALMEGTGYEQI